MTPTLAIIGASYLQRPLVEKAKEMGLRTICFAWAEGAVCRDLVDVFYPISIVEKEQILAICQQEHIDGICTIASDVAAPTVAFVAEQMGLVANTYEASLCANNKWLMRQAFTSADVPCPQHICVTTMDIDAIQARMTLPLIVKPSDRSGSLAVNKITDWAQLLSAIQEAQTASFRGEAMVEEFIEGREISVEFISYQGKHYPLQITDKVTTGAPHFVELEHHQPSTLSAEMYSAIYTITERALQALGITNGASHAEYKITDDGRVYIMEIGARMGGDFIGSDLVQLSTGYDFVRGVIEVALGQFVAPVITKSAYSGVYFLTMDTSYIQSYIENSQIYSNIVSAEQIDHILRTPSCSSERSGYVIYQGQSKMIDCSRKKIMIIGAGAGQVPLIKESKKRGLYTIVVSIDGAYPGIELADVHVKLNIFDMERVLDIARIENIDFVISDQSDFAVPTVAFIAEKLGLLGNSINTAEIYTNKNKQKEFCNQHNFYTSSSALIKDVTDLSNVQIAFPWIIKPSDSQGSRGILKVNDIHEATNAFHEALKYSINKEVIVESFFEGNEIVCEGWVVDGEYTNIAFADRKYFDVPNKFIPSQTIFPSLTPECTLQKIIQQEKEFTKKSGIKFGIIHSEYLVNIFGEFSLVETALRGGGVYISSHLIPKTYNVDLTNLLIDHITLGIEASSDRIRKKNKRSVSAYICFYLNPGIISKVDGLDDVKAHPNIMQADIDNYLPGFVYNGLEHKGSRLGPILVTAADHEELNSVISWLYSTYKIYMNDNSENAIIWN